MRDEPCPCEAFEAEEPDALCFVCTCGHVVEEHKRSFFRPCLVGHSDDDEGKA